MVLVGAVAASISVSMLLRIKQDRTGQDRQRKGSLAGKRASERARAKQRKAGKARKTGRVKGNV